MDAILVRTVTMRHSARAMYRSLAVLFGAALAAALIAPGGGGGTRSPARRRRIWPFWQGCFRVWLVVNSIPARFRSTTLCTALPAR